MVLPRDELMTECTFAAWIALASHARRDYTVEVFILLNAILTRWLDIKDTAGMQGKFSVMRLDGLEARFEKMCLRMEPESLGDKCTRTRTPRQILPCLSQREPPKILMKKSTILLRYSINVLYVASVDH